MQFHDGDDDTKSDTKDEPMGGPGAGEYAPPADLPIPGESEGIDNSQLG